MGRKEDQMKILTITNITVVKVDVIMYFKKEKRSSSINNDCQGGHFATFG